MSELIKEGMTFTVNTRRMEYTVRIIQGLNEIFLQFEDGDEFDRFSMAFNEAFPIGTPCRMEATRNVTSATTETTERPVEPY